MTTCTVCGRDLITSAGTDTPFCWKCDGSREYRIVRFYQNRPGYSLTIRRNLTLREAQTHCQDPETSSSTATSKSAKDRTRRVGPWFDGYSNR